MKHSTASEIRERGRRTIELPSGLKVLIRRVRVEDFVGAGEFPLPATQEKEEVSEPRAKIDEIQRARVAHRRYGNRTIVSGAMAPRFSDDETDADKPDVALVTDLDESDWLSLVETILKFSGLTKEVGQAAESFRTDNQRVDSPGDGVDVRETPHGDPQANPAGVSSEHGHLVSRDSETEARPD